MFVWDYINFWNQEPQIANRGSGTIRWLILYNKYLTHVGRNITVASWMRVAEKRLLGEK
jgi:hypothetical protein